MKLRDALRGKLTESELNVLRASFDVVGDIAIVEIPFELESKEKIIGAALLNMLKNVKTVAAKVGRHYGKYRRQRMKVIAGENRFTTLHTESGLKFKLDVSKCYFSIRLGSERLRIAKLIKPKEKVLVVGSGVGPYPLVFAKHSEASHVTAVELNPAAHKFAVENIVLNKFQEKVSALKADASKLRSRFDRIVVVMPQEGVSFAKHLMKNLKPGAYLHIQDFAPEMDMDAPARTLREICKSKKRSCRILRVVKCGQHAVRSYRVCVDARVV